MSFLRRLLLVAPLLWSVAGEARRPPPGAKKDDPKTRCNDGCMERLMGCQQRCGRIITCISKCSVEMTACTRKCGGPPPSRTK